MGVGAWRAGYLVALAVAHATELAARMVVVGSGKCTSSSISDCVTNRHDGVSPRGSHILNLGKVVVGGEEIAA